MNQGNFWQPSCDLRALEQRAKLLSSVRAFFAERNVIEVDTPSLSHHSVTDVHLRAFNTCFISPISDKQPTLYLQTSPEFAMKRLLCAGSGCIYQLGKCYRNEEAGRNHNPEFTMLEWYRLGFDHLALIDEIDQLLIQTLGTQPLERVTYQSLFLNHCQFDPLCTTLGHVKQIASDFGFADIARNELNIDTLLQLLFSHVIEPVIGQKRPIAVLDFPASQAALARLEPKDKRVARRFEVYYQGFELANGYHELQSAQEHKVRFEHDNQLRQELGLPLIEIDPRFIQALEQGLPDCAGVALGFDRLLMIAAQANHIKEILPFDVNRA